MRKMPVIFLIVLVFCLGAIAQTKQSPRPALPKNLDSYIDEYPVKLLKVPAVKTRLKTLLGKNYSTFDLQIAVQSPMTKVGDFLLGTGCLPHACTISEAAFAIDLKNRRIHAVIYNQNRPPKYFNEDKAETPQVLLDWIEETKGK